MKPNKEISIDEKHLSRAIIRVWPGRERQSRWDDAELSEQHFSLQTAENYMSFWRAGDPNYENEPGAFNPFFAKLKTDHKRGGHPCLLICFYKLDIEAINKKFIEIKEEAKQAPKGHRRERGDREENSHFSAVNGASFIKQLLAAGGLDLNPGLYDFCEQIKEAKRAELEKHPETASYQFTSPIEGEAETTELEAKQEKRCLMM